MQKAELSEIESFLAAHPDVQYVDAILFDLCGVTRGKRYPRQDAHKLYTTGMQIPRSVFLLDANGDCHDALGYGFSDGDPDGDAFPVPGSLTIVPWAKVPSAQVLVSLFDEHGRPEEKDPRSVLFRVAEIARERGFKPVMALELEFYLIDRERTPDGRPLPPISPATGKRDKDTQVYGMAELDAYGDFLRDLEDACHAQNVPAYTASSEFAPGQFELNLKHVEDPLTAADHAGLLKRVIMSIAEKHGFEATFMPKPWLDQAGSGQHIHLSMCNTEGVNLFAAADGGPSDMLRHAVAGMQATMDEAMAIFAPSVNSFRRFQPNIYVPVTKAWGHDNRSVAFRVPGGDAESRRIEHRVAGADANPYLTAAAVLAGALHGMEQKLDPGEPVPGNAGEEVDPELPLTWAHALERLDEATILPEYLGRHYLQMYSATKAAEMEVYRNYISRREYDWYL